MPSTFKLRHFSNPATLKTVSRQLLVRFLKPHRAFLTERGFELQDSDAFDYDALASILMTPDGKTPEALLDGLFFVDEMSMPEYFDDLRTKATKSGIDLGDEQDVSPADLALQMRLKCPNVLEEMHAERFLTKPKSFHSFPSTASSLPKSIDVSEELTDRLERELNDWFSTKKRGRGTKVFPFHRDRNAKFLVRHGEPYKREGTIKDDKPSSIYYRPEKFDVLAYNLDTGELAIHAETKGVKEAYCKIFGKHIFGSETFFDAEGRSGNLTLRPIIEDGRACLVCNDVSGIEEIRLTDLHFRHDGDQNHVEIHKADDVFERLERISRPIPPKATLLKAGFKVKFADAVRHRTVVISPPAKTVYDRESDSETLNQWMEKRGFVCLATKKEDAQVAEVLEIP